MGHQGEEEMEMSPTHHILRGKTHDLNMPRYSCVVFGLILSGPGLRRGQLAAAASICR